MTPIGAAAGIGAFDPMALVGDVGGVGGGAKVGKVADATKATDGAGNGFANVLADKLQQLNATQNDSNLATQDMATGNVDDVAQTMMRIEQANVSLQMATQVRNKVIEAYQETLRMQI